MFFNVLLPAANVLFSNSHVLSYVDSLTVSTCTKMYFSLWFLVFVLSAFENKTQIPCKPSGRPQNYFKNNKVIEIAVKFSKFFKKGDSLYIPPRKNIVYKNIHEEYSDHYGEGIKSPLAVYFIVIRKKKELCDRLKLR